MPNEIAGEVGMLSKWFPNTTPPHNVALCIGLIEFS